MRYPTVGGGENPGGAGLQDNRLQREAEQERKRQQGLQIAQLILGSIPAVGGLLSGITGGVGMATQKKPSQPVLPQPAGQAVNDPNFQFKFDPRYYAS